MIKRFEDEYPETRLSLAPTSPPLPDMTNTIANMPAHASTLSDAFSDTEPAILDTLPSDDEEGILRPHLSRHNSDVSLAGRALAQEEGQIHRFGQQFRRDILKPETEDHLHGTSGREETPRHLQLLRAMVEGLGGDEIKNQLMAKGNEGLLEELNNEASALRQQLMDQDPEGWENFRESQEKAMRNLRLEGRERNVSAIE
jgi:hypothetical protein